MKLNYFLFTIFISSLLLFNNLFYITNVSGALGAFDSGRNITDDSFRTWSVALGDVDNDGDLDVVTGNGGTSVTQINRVYINQGNGASWIGYNITNDSHRTLSVALADFNGDGLLDVVSGNRNQRNRVYINGGDGTTWTGYDLTTDSDQTHYVDVGDMDGDGDIDIVAGNYTQRSRIYLNAGNGISWTRYDLATTNYPTSCIRVRDMDNDGRMDIVLANYGSSSRSKWFRNNGDGINYTEYNVTNNTYNTNYVVVRDLNNDGLMDIIAINENQRSRVLINNGGGTSWTQSDFSTDIYRSSSAKATGDLDEDGYLDVIVGNFGSGQRSRFYINNGTGTIWTGYNLSNDIYQNVSVDMGDIDADGDMDVVMGNGFDTNQVNRLYFYLSAPKLVSSLSVTPDTVTVGEVINVSMNVQNIGDTIANNVVPSLLTVSGTGNVTLLSGPVPASTNISGRSQSSFTWTYQTTSSGTISFSGNANADSGISSPMGTSNTVTILSPAALSSSISASPGTVTPGQTITVTMTVNNTGGEQANNVTPSALMQGGAGTVSGLSGPSPVSANIPAGGNQTFTWACTASTAGTKSFTGNASGTGAVSGSTVSSTPTTSNTVTILTPASLTSSISGAPVIVTPGQTITVNMTVQNSGQERLLNVTPSALSKGGSATAALLTGPIPITTDLEGSSQTSFVWTFRADTPGLINFTGNATGTSEISSNVISSSSNTSNDISILEAIGLVSSISASPKGLKVGQNITVIMTVQNTGGELAVNVTPSAITNNAPSSLKLVSGPTPASTSIEPSLQETFTWIYTANTAGLFNFTANASGEGYISGSHVSSPLSISNDVFASSNVPINAALQSAYNLRIKTVESLQSQILDQMPSGCKQSGISSSTCNIPEEIKLLWAEAEMHMENSRNTGNIVEALNELQNARELFEQILKRLNSQ